MKTNRFFWGLAMMSAAVMFASCEKTEEPPVEEPDGSDETEVTCTLSEKTLTFGNAEEEKTFTVTSNADWKLEVKTDSEDKWITVDPTSGTASDKAVTVKVTVTANKTGEEREATLTVSPEGGDAMSLTVTQSASAEEPVDPSITFGDTESVELLQAGGDVKFNVTANVDWTAVAVFTLEDGTEAQAEEGTETTEGWFSFTPVDGTASEAAVEITVTAKGSNDSETPLQGKIVFTAAAEEGEDAKTFEIPVTQAAKEAAAMYSNNFDKTAVSADTELTGDEWKNETVSGNFTYSDYGVKVSKDNASPVSGSNNIFFDAVSYFQLNGVGTVSGNVNYTLSFSVYSSDSQFNAEEFLVYVGNASKWAQLTYNVTAKSDGWNEATVSFRLPGSSTMDFYFTATAPGKYRIDDLKVTESLVNADPVAFSTTFGNTEDVTVANFLTKTPSTTVKYRITEATVVTVDGADVTVSQEEATVLLSNLDLNGQAEALAEGDKVTVVGYRDVDGDNAVMSRGILEAYKEKVEEVEGAASGDELIISEFVYQNNHIYIEIYNPTDKDITFDYDQYSYTIKILNSTGTQKASASLTGYGVPTSIASKEAIVYTSDHNQSSYSFLNSLGYSSYDGTETGVQLTKRSDILDACVPGDAVGSKSYKRKLSVGEGSSSYNAEEWEISDATLEGLGTR